MPNWKSVYRFYARLCWWNAWEKVLDEINRRHRVQQGRNPYSSYVIIDSQSVKSVSGRDQRGFDGEKKVEGRKRHIGVDMEGHLLHVEVTAVNTLDTIMGGYVIESVITKHPTVEAASADAGYRGNTIHYAEIRLDTLVHISTNIRDTFAVLPKRWIVERTFAWFNIERRLAKDYDVNPLHSENLIRIAMLKKTLAWLCSIS
ncbi:MAG: transposase [bacterium]